MAVIYKGIERKLAKMDEVQADLEYRTFVMAVRAEELLAEHVQAMHGGTGGADVSGVGDSTIDVVHGDIDWFVVLNDEAGQLAALSIEFGRQADPENGISGMEGLYILTRATHIPIKRRGGIRL